MENSIVNIIGIIACFLCLIYIDYVPSKKIKTSSDFIVGGRELNFRVFVLLIISSCAFGMSLLGSAGLDSKTDLRGYSQRNRDMFFRKQNTLTGE
ncbi:MAG: hypothetical protein NTX32_08275 [Candidatus Firestonebacteria bacterium]|nr:hypothetical protein [Candidatus Firestonebacteria bacterium]